MLTKGILKSGLLIALIISTIGTAFSQAGNDQSLLWEISGNGLKENSYLFGTIHLICASDFIMDDRIQNAFKDADKLIMELDMDDPTVMIKMQQLSMNAKMRNIKSEFSEEDLAKLDEVLISNYGAGMDQLGVLKPFVLISMLTLKMLPCDPVESYELFFTKKAANLKKEIEGLESVEFQMGIFDEIPESVQIQEIKKLLSGENSLEEFEKLLSAYLAEDINQLYEVATSGEMMENFDELMLDNRNKNWIPVMEKSMLENQVFFAVGSGHLGGEYGLINLLRAEGYQVRPLK